MASRSNRPDAVRHFSLSAAAIIRLLVFLSIISTTAHAQDCSGPATGCNNGLWDVTECKCICIPPYCVDWTGDCLRPTGCDNTVNPWRDCEVGKDCPWWNDETAEESCTSGSNIPVGVWNIHSSNEACCNVHHPFSTTCAPPAPEADPTPAPVPLDAGIDDTHEVVGVKFNIGGLPDAVNMRELRDEMLKIVKRVLADLMGKVQDLKVTYVEENLVLTTMPQVQTNGDMRSVFYDITVLRRPGRKFGPIVIAALRDSYAEIMDDIEEYVNTKYFDITIDLSPCTDQDEGDDSFTMCTNADDDDDDDDDATVEVIFRLTNIPRDLNADDLIRKIIDIYRSLLKLGDKSWDFIGLQYNRTIDISATDGGRRITKEVHLDAIVTRNSEVPDLGRAISNRLHNGRYDVLKQIQSYTDTSTNLELDWCINGERAYGICPPSPKAAEEEGFMMPLWAIITLASLGVVFCCIFFWCIMACVNQDKQSKDESNLTSYIQSGPSRGKDQKQIRSSHLAGPPPPHRPPPPRRHQSDRMCSQPRRPSLGQPHHSMRETQSMGWADSESAYRDDLSLRNKDVTYLEEMPSYVFDNDDETRRDMTYFSQVPPIAYETDCESRPSFAPNGGTSRAPHHYDVEDEYTADMTRESYYGGNEQSVGRRPSQSSNMYY